MPTPAIHIVPSIKHPIRLSDYAVDIFDELPSRAGMRKAIKKGRVKVNGELAGTGLFIRGGERIELLSDKQNTEKLLTGIKLRIVYEDDYLAVISKPSGILISGNKHKTIDNALSENLKPSQAIDALSRPRAAHRLDFPTSGLLLIGKTQSSLESLNKMFEQRVIQKTYFAVTLGKMDPLGLIQVEVDGKPSQTRYKVVETKDSPRHLCLNLLEISPATGRRHQIRIHLASIGHPIIGDKEYGNEETQSIGTGLYLHAGKLAFNHPITNEAMQLFDDLPKKFRRIFDWVVE